MQRSARKGKPTALSDLVANVLRKSGVADRVAQAEVLSRWAGVVGDRIARVAEPELITADGVLFVRVESAAWRQELSLMTRDIIARLNAGRTAGRVEGIRWMLGAARG
jgi:predicted nucleic acid-binding Zn ribbon protein